MARCLAMWEAADLARATALNQRTPQWAGLMGRMEQDLKKGAVRDYGFFMGERNGFAILEGTKGEVERAMQHYAEFLSFTVYPLASPEQAEQVLEAEPDKDLSSIRQRFKGRSFRCYSGFLKMP